MQTPSGPMAVANRGPIETPTGGMMAPPPWGGTLHGARGRDVLEGGSGGGGGGWDPPPPRGNYCPARYLCIKCLMSSPYPHLGKSPK